jgi:hypothetical protein
MIINVTGMNDEATLFTLMKHRINSTGWMMKWWWDRGVEQKANPDIERMLNVFDLHFSTPAEKAVSRICASKTRRNLQTFGWCLQFKQSCPWATLSYFCLRNKAGKINERGRVVLRKNVSEKLSVIYPLWNEEKSLANWIRYICRQKTTTSLWNVSDMTICETHKLFWLWFEKGNFYLQRSRSGG